MKWVLLSLVLFAGCTEGPNCFMSRGDLVSKSIVLGDFESITLSDDISIELKNGPQQVVVSTGANLISGINFEIVDGRLAISNANSCNWSRKYGKTVVAITLPDYKEIELLGFGTVTSSDVLAIDQLRIISLDSPSDVELALSGGTLHISSNDVSNFTLEGQIEMMHVGFYYGNGILNGKDLTVENLVIDHRGSNNILVAPTQSVTGEMTGTGDLHLYTQPIVSDVIISGDCQIISVAN